MTDEVLPVLDLYQRTDSDGQPFLVGAFAGLKVSIHRLKQTDRGARVWRAYLSGRAQGVLRDRHRPTSATPPPPLPPSEQGRAHALAELGTALDFYRTDEEEENR